MAKFSYILRSYTSIKNKNDKKLMNLTLNLLKNINLNKYYMIQTVLFI